ncbi:coiled-coil domain-containing protein 38 isoform X7 [Canis lupus baileyi]|uniref:coiled-coil domain-containing protein 38 isoform X6 n=1 Tax=Canis lupus dingo TaxID=286419 RepID=UPI0020C58D22|nr:coiled-coil domain-containing protein 38 isoform X6 [Canis lupus dingo]
MSSQFFPISLASEDKGKDDSVKKDRPYKIFFKDLFLFKENEMAAKKKEKFINRSMKVYQKSTFSSRMKSRSHLGQVAFYSDATGGSFEKFGLDPTLILRLTEGADTKRTLHEFINDQRDRFLLEYALSTKRNTIKKFENHMAVKEQQLIKAEKKLQEDAMAFEEFLRENDQRSVDALKMAAQETINKLQMTTELKKASMEVQAVKSEIAKAEFLLREYMKYGFFLLKLSPKHWQIQQALKRVQMTTSRDSMNVSLPVLAKLNRRKTESNIEESRKISFSDDYYMERGSQGKPRKKTTLTLENRKSSLSTYDIERKRGRDSGGGRSSLHAGSPTRDSIPGLQDRALGQSHTDSISSEDSLELFLDEDMDYDLEPELYFKEPEELLQVLTELEEQNLTLVQYSQDVDENLEDVNKREKLIQDKMLREEKMKEKQKHQEERLKAALERAVAQPKKKLGRQLVYRSKPPSGNKHELLLVKDTRTKSLEEEYFFT